MTKRTLVVMTATALALAGCGSQKKADSGTASTSDVLRIPYLADMSVPDPDVFYDVEGNSVILNTYQGLLKYAPNSTKIVGNLATSWSVSPDRLTYTFKLRPGVRFHDGTPLTSKAVKASFQRRLDVGQAPSYMLAEVKKMTTPDAGTFVVTLRKRGRAVRALHGVELGAEDHRAGRDQDARGLGPRPEVPAHARGRHRPVQAHGVRARPPVRADAQRRLLGRQAVLPRGAAEDHAGHRQPAPAGASTATSTRSCTRSRHPSSSRCPTA